MAESRAGMASRAISRRRQKQFIRRAWRPLLLALLGGAALAPLVGLVVPDSIAQVAVGAWLASVVWFVVLTVLLFTGSGQQIMGSVAEQWTAETLRSMRPQGWWSVDALRLLDRGDIDHLAVGPAGVIVLETKWRSGDWDLDDLSAYPTRDAERHLLDARRRVQLWLRKHLGDTAVTMVAVAWGADGSGTRTLDSGVMVVAGDGLRGALEALPDPGLTADQLRAIRSEVERQLEIRQAHDDRSGEKVVRSYYDILKDAALFVVVALVASLAAIWASVAVLHWPLAGLAVVAGLGLAWTQRTRGLAAPALVGFAGGLLLIVGAVAVTLLGQ